MVTQAGAPPGDAHGERAPLRLVQCARGLAALSVLLFHFGVLSQLLLHRVFLFDLFRMGESGVDFFFVLSGFIITFVHAGDLQRPARFRAYLMKRVVRIYPIYWLITFAVLPIYLLGYGVAEKRQPAVILKSLALWPQDLGVWPILNVAWTLSHEVFFYGLFGLAILLPTRAVAPVLAALLLVSLENLCLQLGLHVSPAQSAWQNLLFSRFNLEFALGCASAVIATRWAPARPMPIFLAGIAWLLLAWGLEYRGLVATNSVVLFALPYFLIVLGAACLDLQGAVSPPRIFEALGDATYTVYLSHFVLLTAGLTIAAKLRLVERCGYAPTSVAIIATVLTIGWLIHRHIEKPLLGQLRGLLVQPAQPRLPATGAVPG